MKDQAYQTLGIAKDASERDVRRAYRALLFELEDKGQADPEYPAKKKLLQDAFDVCLADAQARGVVTPESQLTTVVEDPEAVKKRLALRLALGLFGIAAIFGGFQFFKSRSVDPNGETPTETIGMIAALEVGPSSSKAVIFKSDGSKITSPGYKDGTIDRDIAWRPDGGRLFFVSDRNNANFNIFRWDPKSDKTDLRSTGKRAKGSLWYGWDSEGAKRDEGLFTSGGFVMKYDQKKPATEQIVPPVKGKTQSAEGDDQGTTGQIESMYKTLGEAFLSAKWGIERQVVWAIMRRESDALFLWNPLTKAYGDGRPKPLFAGKAIEFDVNEGGDAVAAVREYQFIDLTAVPEKYLENGKPVLPFNSAIYFCPADGSQPAIVCHTKGSKFFFGGVGQQPNPVMTADKETLALAQPAISRDGKLLVIVLGKLVGDKNFEGISLIAIPLKEDAPIKQPGRVAIGPVSDPSFSPDGQKITYLKLEANGKHAIYTANTTGGVESKVSDDADYATPKFSPQMAAATSSGS